MAPRTSRRAFLATALRLGASLSVGGIGYTMIQEPSWLDIEQVTVPIRNLPPALHDLTIAHLSDLHVSEIMPVAQIAEAVRRANWRQPDLVVLTGDYVTHGREFIAPAVAAMARLRAPLGVYAVLGNHDHWSGAPDRIQALLEDVGITVLQNAHKQIAVGDSRLWLAGVDDVHEQQDDIRQAMRGIPEDGVRLLLAHEPDFADVAALHGVHLQLSGHSHGGQVRLPGIGALRLPHLGRRYPMGLQRVPGSDTQVYTTRGVGLVKPAVRFNCRPEVTILRLVPAEA